MTKASVTGDVSLTRTRLVAPLPLSRQNRDSIKPCIRVSGKSSKRWTAGGLN
jgi:hypothetical protein